MDTERQAGDRNIVMFWHDRLGLVLVRVEDGEMGHWRQRGMDEDEADEYAAWLEDDEFSGGHEWN